MKILVTGGTGFIGSHFLRLAIAAGHEVIALRRPGAASRIPLPDPPRWVDGGLADPAVSDHARGCAALVHFAAAGVQPAGASFEECIRVNVVQSHACWSLAAAAGVRRFLICGSCFEYGASGERFEFIPPDAPLEPTAPYHASKAAATMLALAFARSVPGEVLVLRPFHVYGEGEHPDRFWPSLRQAALAGRDFPMSPGEQVRDFVDVRDVARRFCDGLVRTDLVAGQPRIENVGTGRPQTLLGFARHWWDAWGATGRLVPGAVPYRPGEVMRYVPKL